VIARSVAAISDRWEVRRVCPLGCIASYELSLIILSRTGTDWEVLELRRAGVGRSAGNKGADAKRMRSGCEADAKRMRSGCEADAKRMRSGCEADAKRMRSGCEADAKRMRSGCEADAKRRVRKQDAASAYVLRPRSNAGVLFQKEKMSEEVSGKGVDRKLGRGDVDERSWS
jgi:hypothetical protein